MRTHSPQTITVAGKYTNLQKEIAVDASGNVMVNVAASTAILTRIHGKIGTSWVPVAVDSSGYVHVIADMRAECPPDLKYVQCDSSGYLLIKSGYGDALHPVSLYNIRGSDSGIPWHFKSHWRDALSKSAGGASDTLSSAQVPSGEIWVLTRVCVYCQTTGATSCEAQVRGGGVISRIIEWSSLNANETYSENIEAYLHEGSYCYFAFTGLTAGNIIRAYMFGYKMIAP